MPKAHFVDAVPATLAAFADEAAISSSCCFRNRNGRGPPTRINVCQQRKQGTNIQQALGCSQASTVGRCRQVGPKWNECGILGAVSMKALDAQQGSS